MRPQKIITINLLNNNGEPVICPSTGEETAIHLDEQDYDTLLKLAKDKYEKGLTDREYMERIVNSALSKQLNLEK